jgi:hypothetical protein
MKASKKQSWLADRQYVGKPVGQRGSWFATVKWEDGESSPFLGQRGSKETKGALPLSRRTQVLSSFRSSVLTSFLAFCFSVVAS